MQQRAREERVWMCLFFVVFKEALHNFQEIIVVNDIHVQKVSCTEVDNFQDNILNYWHH